MHIGILMCGHLLDPLQPVHGDYDAMFARLLDGHGFTFQSWDVEGMAFPETALAADAWIVSGSRHGVYEDHAFIAPLEQFVRDIYAADRPLVGICFGHQIIARALGGTVVKFDGGWSVGRRDYAIEGADPIALNAWHQDQVITLPTDAKRLAQNDFCENAMLVYGTRAFTVQAHPEFQNRLIGDLVHRRRGTGTYPDDRMDQASRDIALPVQSDRMGDAIARFLKTRVVHV
ncbi:type 1 glutamine amidotransferase [Jannaschia sp. M317]|uniref:type 1 glutamine amidotransferase n=1 Tax=Jannaschia sp. M317 TaxID=2867011 RepID=UPI0021A6C120|nr:type 1 glutamine amidotransferase [Jannaschia sp. M317]UWQ18645.1 type 1 glutamine amidotransferase [Jannaschia sp. M317]